MTEPDKSPPWRLEVSARARRDVNRLPSRIAAAIVEFVTKTLPENPERMSKPLTGEFEGLRTARRGDYRVLIELHPADRVILVARIGHRAHVYRPN
ncbi:MAG: type II toxin-antitoxin system RelE/ParE family toxin [Nocardioides sp.]